MDIQRKFLGFTSYLFDEIRKAKNLEGTDPNYLLNLQKNISEFIKPISDLKLTRKFSYFADEMIIKDFGTDWSNFLIEKVLFRTNQGGEKFFDDLKEELLERNIPMIKISALMLKMGFKGAFEKVPEEFEQKITFCFESKQVLQNKDFVYSPPENKLFLSLWNFLWIGIFVLLVISLFNFTKYKVVFLKCGDLLEGEKRC